jgi:hypothetical protein
MEGDWSTSRHRELAPSIVDIFVYGKLAGPCVCWRADHGLIQAVCGCASDDIRVRSAVKQVFQLFGTVRRQEPPKVNVHFIFQYLIVSDFGASSFRPQLYINRLGYVRAPRRKGRLFGAACWMFTRTNYGCCLVQNLSLCWIISGTPQPQMVNLLNGVITSDRVK